MITIGVSDEVDKAGAVILSNIAKVDRVLDGETWCRSGLGDFGVNGGPHSIQPTIMREVVDRYRQVYRAIAPALDGGRRGHAVPDLSNPLPRSTSEQNGKRGVSAKAGL